MKRLLLLRHLKESGCVLLREGARHSLYINPFGEQRAIAVPRHQEVNDFLVKQICRDLGIPSP
mgnify:CR=1 FL=1